MSDQTERGRGYTSSFLKEMMQRVRADNPGLDEQVLAEAMVETFVRELPSAIEDEASKLMDAILEGTALDPSAEEHAQWHAGFCERLDARWGHAFDLHRVFILTVQGFLMDLGQQRTEDPDEDFEQRAPAAAVGVVLGLLGKAVLASHEVLWLLSGGFPFGARAHSRTLNEIALVANLVRRDDGGETAHRYLAHGAVAEYHEATDYQAACKMTGWEPLTDKELQELKAAKDKAVAEHGAHFGSQGPTFEQLAATADLSHWRISYRESSHRVHAGVRGLELNILTRDDRTISLTGPTNVQLEV